MASFELYCLKCGKPATSGYQAFCDVCDGIIEVRYPTDGMVLPDSTNPYERFAPLLPVLEPARRLPRGVGYTPLHHATAIGGRLGMPQLYLKNETVLPTGTTKDRMAAVSLAYLYEQGVRSFTTSSTGNSSSSYAHAMSNYPEMHLYLFTAESFATRVAHADQPQITHFVLRDGTFVEAFEAGGAYAKRHGVISERGFFNVGRREGLKLAFMEAAEQSPRPIDWYVQAVSSAMGVYGTNRAAEQLRALGLIDRLPRLLSVQQESCAPMVHAFEDGVEAVQPQHVVKRPHGIAEAILRGDPSRAYPFIRDITIATDGGMVAVSEQEIRDARRMVEELEGISPCFSGSAAVAGIVKLVREDRFPRGDTVMINLTGSDRPPAALSPDIHWLRRTEAGGVTDWVPEDETATAAAQ